MATNQKKVSLLIFFVNECGESKVQIRGLVARFPEKYRLKARKKKKTHPKATTRAPCSLMADFLHPGHILSSRWRKSVRSGFVCWILKLGCVGAEAMEASIVLPRQDVL